MCGFAICKIESLVYISGIPNPTLLMAEPFLTEDSIYTGTLQLGDFLQ